MSADIPTSSPAAPVTGSSPGTPVTPSASVTPARALHAEWLKFRTLASNPLTAFASLGMIVALSGVLVWARAGESVSTSPVELLTGVSWAQLLLAVLAVVFVCSEWASGTSRVTFLAVPARWPVLLGKAAVVGAVSFVVGALGAAGALALGAAGGVEVSADTGLAIRLVLGAGVYLGALSVLSLGLGAIARNLVGGILTVIGFLWVLPLAVTLIPSPVVQRLIAYLPSPAGGQLLAVENPSAPLTPWAGGAVLLIWSCAALVGATIAVRVRDI
ncbi:ABC-type transport system involved in multi-copper enzyme maturation permease subunit [Microbacterium resistens]|uniref:ABC-type transport system involved in multi-copper enzyme maturation permease subunit n=1 Tax=Microbacterium resistens TaxID=156977 RepID=A0ABU1SF62_9MICO|nr:hypothetical protein [Microbacterium resistens]MDR6867903.1 ABC-type transport system involved in multi-copper enzyme maturation permease subunit [Microbacterium resistens]